MTQNEINTECVSRKEWIGELRRRIFRAAGAMTTNTKDFALRAVKTALGLAALGAAIWGFSEVGVAILESDNLQQILGAPLTGLSLAFVAGAVPLYIGVKDMLPTRQAMQSRIALLKKIICEYRQSEEENPTPRKNLRPYHPHAVRMPLYLCRPDDRI